MRLTTLTVLATAAPETVGTVALFESVTPSKTLVLRGELFHVQGIDVDDSFIYVTSVDTKTDRALLHKFDRNGDMVGAVDLTDGSLYHPGGLVLDDTSIWVPVAEYTPTGKSRIMRLDKTSLKILSSYEVSDHIGAISVQGDRVYGANWDSRHLYVWNRDGRLVSKTASPTGVAYQDMKFVGADLVASGVMGHKLSGSIDWLDAETFKPRQRLLLGRTQDWALWTREGMAIRGEKLFLLPQDGNGREARLHIFQLADLARQTYACSASANDLCPIPAPESRVANAH